MTSLPPLPSFEASTDGDDYIEGNGGNDVIFGNLGQDDIIGGSSDLYNLTGAAKRPDGTDLIFGGAGIDISRNNAGDATASSTGDLIVNPRGHAMDADVIIGDNGRILRLVGVNGHAGVNSSTPSESGVAISGGFLNFNYDSYPGDTDPATYDRIIAHAVQFLDYTPGGPSYDIRALTDIGGIDEIHGESGDDSVYGMKGDDVIYGDGQDDDLTGGWGNDWISGGTGQDGILGDDGRIMTSRNRQAASTTGSLLLYSTKGEPLYGIAPLLATDPDTRFSNGNVVDEYIYSPGQVQNATANPHDALNKAFNITPFNLTPEPNADDPLFRPSYADDIIFGGLGDDFLHGASGDDALLGAEAQVEAYTQVYTTGALTGVARSDFDRPFNPGDVLHFGADTDAWHSNNHIAGRLGEFALYDEYDPRRTILLNPDGTAQKDGAGYWWFLNFKEEEGPTRTDPTWGTVNTDGDDVIFGDLGNDWSVGGTGKDTLWAGWGNDLSNADDVLTTGVPVDGRSNAKKIQPSPNDTPDTHPTYEDRVYGGAGLDILIGNTGGDRLIDWVGEFNSYIVPFAPFGIATVSRQVPPALFEFLYALSKSQGADPTRTGDTFGDPARNGEPHGELGLVVQKDIYLGARLWQQQTGGPSDPQPGNIPGGKRDVLRSSDFNNGQAQGFVPDSGNWTVTNGRLQISPSIAGGDAASVYYIDNYLPTYYETAATINAVKPTAGLNANSYLIFDYQSPTDFKFAGVNVATNKMEMGHRTAAGWIVDKQSPVPGQVKSDTDYTILLSVNGLSATVVLNGTTSLTNTYTPRVDADGVKHFLNEGLIGIGANNGKAQIDNVVVQRLPDTIAYNNIEDFSDGVADAYNGQQGGRWQVVSGRYGATPAAGSDRAYSLTPLGATSLSVVDLTTTLQTQTMGGVIFDAYAPDDFKFAVISAQTNQVLIGHYNQRKGWVIDASASKTILAGTDYQLDLSFKGVAANVSVNGQPVVGFSFNSAVSDGNFGLFSRNGTTSFDVAAIQVGELASAPASGPPVAANDAATTLRDTAVIVPVLANDSDPNGDALTVVNLTQPASGVAALNANGTVTYTPAAGFIGTATFTYKASDGTNQSNVATVTITVNDKVNHAPVAVNDSVKTSKDTAVTINLLANDTDSDADRLSVTALVQPANGIVSLNGDGTVLYTPKAGFTGSDTFTYKASDGQAESAPATVTVVINSAPVAANDTASTNKGQAVTVSVLANDTDANGETLTVTALTQPSSGVVAVNPAGTAVIYTPANGFAGTVTFTYKASDGTAQSNTATVTVTVTNRLPVAVNDTGSTFKNTAVALSILGNDSDPDGDPLTVKSVTQPGSGGTTVINANGTVSYTPKGGFVGTDTFSYIAFDGQGQSNSATVTVQVTNRAPIAVADSVSTGKGVVLTVPVLSNDSDPDGDPLSVGTFTQPLTGSVVLNSNGTFTYTPKKNFTGTDTFTYKASDGAAQSGSVTVTIKIT